MNTAGENNPGRRILGRRVSGNGKYFDGNGNGNVNNNSSNSNSNSASMIIREEECDDLWMNEWKKKITMDWVLTYS